MSLILPKGIVVNSPGISGSIERMNEEALDLADIAKLWKVYTTTKRRLLDPTAERLENYWWRIWGSRARRLKGATVARLFAQISDGQTFVPLRGPTNRDEGLSATDRYNTPSTSDSNVPSKPRMDREDEECCTKSSTQTSIPPASPHPILKKTRGPSNNGPRPTAHFISPYESEDDTEPNAPSSTAPSSTGAHVNGITHQKENVIPPNKNGHVVLHLPTS